MFIGTPPRMWMIVPPTTRRFANGLFAAQDLAHLSIYHTVAAWVVGCVKTCVVASRL